MRFCYLRLVLLTSAIAANAVTDTAETNVALTASRAASSPTFVRDNLAASAVTATQRIDDEDRGWTPIAEFAKLMGKKLQSKAVKGIKSRVFDKYIDERMTPRKVFFELGLTNPYYRFLSDVRWIEWTFLLFQISRYFEENEYEFIIAAMSATHDAVKLSDKLLSAVKNKKTKPFAMNLISVAGDRIKGRVFKKLPQLDRELLDQKQHSAENIRKTLYERIDAYLKKPFVNKKKGRFTKKLDNSEQMKFSVLTSYLSVLFSKDHVVGTGQNVATKYFEDAALLKYLLSLDKFDDQVYIKSLVSIYFEVDVSPFKIVSMLVQDESEANHFAIFFLNKSSRRFWLHYLEMYYERYYSNKLTRTAIADFEQLLQMLDDIAMNTNAPEKAFSDSAISTWLKVLTLPHLALLEKSQVFRENLMSIWLMEGVFPSSIVSALLLGEAEDKCLTILFLDETSRNFWVRYVEQYIQKLSNKAELAQFEKTEFVRLFVKLFAVVNQESQAADKFVAYRTIFKMLVSPYFADLSSIHEHVIELTSILLLDMTPPSKVVSMLMHGEADADKFKILFVNKSSKSFWVRYLKLYFEHNFKAEDFASKANADFQRLLYMLHAVGLQGLAKADKLMVSSTILKMLISPEIAKVVDQRYLKEMVLTWLQQKIPPCDVVSMLVLEEEELDYPQILFTNTPSSNLWKDYTKAYYADTSAQQIQMMLALNRAFGNAKLKRVLNAALTIKATSEKAKAPLF